MNLTKEVFKIDAKKISQEMEKFIKEKMTLLARAGTLVPMSGGLDSTTVATLCVRAVGKDKVTGLMLPEKQGNPDAEKYATKVANLLGIKTEKIDISRTLESLGTYDYFVSRIPSQTIRKKLLKLFFALGKENPIIEGATGKSKKFANKGLASFASKQRIRSVSVYKFAEENNLLVVGAAHKSECLTGLFVKFGVDHNADIMPIRNLYRSQILELAKFLGVPEEIITRTPNPDVMPGINDKYVDILKLDYEKVDLILYGLEKDMSSQEIARQLKLKEEKVGEIKQLMCLTDHMRNPSQAPDFAL